MDALNTSSSNEKFEADLIWDSAGKLTDDGYTVEIRLPLQSIRFSSGLNVKMGILFWRHISRTGVSSSWPDIARVTPRKSSFAPCGSTRRRPR